MVADVQVAKLPVVLGDRLLQLDNARVVLVPLVAQGQPAVQLNNHWKRELLAGRVIQPPGGLDDHQGVVVGRRDGHGAQRRVHKVEKLANRVSSLVVLIHLDELRRDLERWAEFHDGPRTELVRVEVVHADRDNPEAAVGGLGECPQRHDGHTGLEREQLGAVVTPSLGENADAPAGLETVKHGLVDLGLVDMGGQLVLGSLEARLWAVDVPVLYFSVLVNVLAGSELSDGNFSLQGALDANLLGPEDHGDVDARSALPFHRWEEEHTANLGLLLKVGADPANKSGIVDRVGEVDGPLPWFRRILSTADRHATDLAGRPSDEA